LKNTTKLEIISLTRQVFDGEVASITVPAQDGQLTILPRHIALMTSLKPGEIIIRNIDGKDDYVAISSGIMVIDPKKITILVDSADMLEDLDEKKIQEAKDRAEKLLTERKFADDVAFADAAALLEKSMAQLKVLKRRKTRR
jgi:F-type H+-transporting ATPase subunit epsilon